jgi:DNA mismatch repair protein MutS
MTKLTPAMQQFMDIKKQYPDSIVLFRMGDFYETFFDDAKQVSKILAITLTDRGGEIPTPLAGIPYHALEKYLKQLVESQKKIVIVEQLENPKFAKGVVKRGVTRVITPGTVIEDAVLTSNTNNFLACVYINKSEPKILYYAYCDISTGAFFCAKTQTPVEQVLGRIKPAEVITSTDMQQQITGYAVQTLSTYFFVEQKCAMVVNSQFAQHSLCSGITIVCGALLSFIADTQPQALTHIKSLTVEQANEFVQLDESTIRNLELHKSATSSQTLLQTLDKTKTVCGSRLLKQWLLKPLTNELQILQRQSAVQECTQQQILLTELEQIFSHMNDIERIIAKVSYRQANPKDILALKQTLRLAKEVHQLTRVCSNALLLKPIDHIQPVIEFIDQTIKDDCPASIKEGGVIKRGYNSQLDEYWNIKEHITDILLSIEKKEIELTQIPTLKIKYNKIIGYYIEISNRYESNVPQRYQKRQSTASSHKYTIPELSELEQKILHSQEKIEQLESELFEQICATISQYATQIQQTAQQLATLDCICSLARVALKYNYCKPQIHAGYDLLINQGRHPVVEVTQPQFIPNDCTLVEQERVMILTGPNMAGKSTYMRQIALITLLAHVGSFVPAQSASIPLIDSLFTRVGSSDAVALGQSTFMVEMTQTAYILEHATNKSLVILDEIGSSTSTYDGIALAWSVAQELAQKKCKTIFATHFHILTKLATIPGITNYRVAVKEENETITFLHQVVKGGTDKSYGLFVAKLAGIPQKVLDVAKKVQYMLETTDSQQSKISVQKIDDKYTKIIQHTLIQDKMQTQTNDNKQNNSDDLGEIHKND